MLTRLLKYILFYFQFHCFFHEWVYPHAAQLSPAFTSIASTCFILLLCSSLVLCQEVVSLQLSRLLFHILICLPDPVLILSWNLCKSVCPVIGTLFLGLGLWELFLRKIVDWSGRHVKGGKLRDWFSESSHLSTSPHWTLWRPPAHSGTNHPWKPLLQQPAAQLCPVRSELHRICLVPPLLWVDAWVPPACFIFSLCIILNNTQNTFVLCNHMDFLVFWDSIFL